MSAAMVKTKHPGIYKRGGRYVYTWRDANSRSRKASAATLAEAKAKRGDEIGRSSRGERVSSRNVTFEQYAREWVVTYTGRTEWGLNEDTRADYRKAIGLDVDGKVLERGAVAFFGRTKLAAIGPRQLREYSAEIASRGVSRNTVRLALAPLKALLATAVEDEILTANPSAGLRNLLPADPADLADDDEHVKALSSEELAALVERLPERWRLFFEFLAETGLRIGETVELRWSDIDLGDRRLHVRRRFYRCRVARPKGGKTRSLRLTVETARALWQLRPSTDGNDLVFTSDRGSRIGQPNLMSRVLKPAAVEAGIGRWVRDGDERRAETWVGFHTFRHTCATGLIADEGWSLEQVQVYLGHADYATTRRYYVHLIPDDLPERTSVRGGNGVATRPTETARNDYPRAKVESA